MTTDRTVLDERIRPFGTPKQQEIFDAVNELGGLRAAGRQLGKDHAYVWRAIKAMQTKAAVKGVAPDYDMVHAVPDPFKVKGVSTYYNKDGVAAGQWVKSQLDQETLDAAIKAALAAMAEEIPRLGAMPAPTGATAPELLNLYTLTDCHVGMLAWRKEGGEDWDLKIAERTLVGCFEQMIHSAPPAQVGFINQLGDFLHSDGLMPVTPTSGHILDQDGRFSKMVGVAIRVLRRIVDMALVKHDRVVVLLAEGNHDMASSVWLRHMFKALYEGEPRVEVIDTELPYYSYQHGETMLFFHHGHLKKLPSFPMVAAAQYPKIWGNTTHRYAHAGHMHHLRELEDGGMTVTQHPTLSARDAYASRGGYFADRAAYVIVYHARYGQVARNTVSPEMLAA